MNLALLLLGFGQGTNLLLLLLFYLVLVVVGIGRYEYYYRGDQGDGKLFCIFYKLVFIVLVRSMALLASWAKAKLRAGLAKAGCMASYVAS